MNRVEPEIVFIGLGSNLEEPRVQIQQALIELDSLRQTSILATSSLYASAPMGPQDQPDYLNAVAKISTFLSVTDLLDELKAIEQAHQRLKTIKWGPRTLDLDILLFGTIVYHSDSLTVPHPGITSRNFVLYPLYEIAADLMIPGHGALSALIADCPATNLRRLASNE